MVVGSLLLGVGHEVGDGPLAESVLLVEAVLDGLSLALAEDGPILHGGDDSEGAHLLLLVADRIELHLDHCLIDIILLGLDLEH